MQQHRKRTTKTMSTNKRQASSQKLWGISWLNAHRWITGKSHS